MPAATASVADVSRADIAHNDADRERKNTGQSKAQCSPMPLPTLGTQKIIHGNGTNVGTIISLECPAKHTLVGSQLKCVMATNSTHWEGETTYCKPHLLFGDYGFRVAVLASIISSAIIFFMSMAFITCCLLDCVKEDKRKKKESELDVWHQDQAQHEDENRSHYNHKGRNNNNNTQEKIASLWEIHNPAMCDSLPACRCHQEYDYGPACTYSSSTPLGALPGQDYDQLLLPQNPKRALTSGPPQYPGPPPSSCQTAMQDQVQMSAKPSLLWQHGGRERRLSGLNLLTTDKSGTRNIKPTEDFSIRIISV